MIGMHAVFYFIQSVVVETAHVFYNMSPFLLLGLFFAGVIHVYIPADKIAASVGKRSALSVIKAALWGVPLPLCSCGVIPAALSLRKHGASKGATVSFLISTPETGIDSIVVTYALLDPIFTVFRPFAAFATAVLCGLTENIFGWREKAPIPPAEKVCHICSGGSDDGHTHTHAGKIWRIFEYGFFDFLGDISMWLFIGIISAGVISAAIPPGFFTKFIGSGFVEMLVMLAVGIPLYICASATTPIAAALIVKGVSPGAALVLLLAGPATNVATIMMVWRFIGRRSAVIYLLSISVVSLAMGFLLNAVYSSTGARPVTEIGACAHAIPHAARFACAITLLVLMVIGIVRNCGHTDEHKDH
ncbi:MAG TPA: SO_0444 family Cu/Zn efflux transporter [bacterium]|nr:SO_0444 family Cu/Zn efflux transporter [bacterium]